MTINAGAWHWQPASRCGPAAAQPLQRSHCSASASSRPIQFAESATAANSKGWARDKDSSVKVISLIAPQDSAASAFEPRALANPY